MEEQLLRKLIEKKYFAPGTEVDAVHKGMDLSGTPLHYFEGTYTVAGLLENQKGKLVLELASVRDGYRVRVKADAIRGIDGMTPLRFAENYMIAPDGTDIKLSGKRRGRRPKGWVDPDLANEG
jgi:hypothetical protein